MSSDKLKYRDERLKVIEKVLKAHGVIDPKEKGIQLKAKLKWLYLIDMLLARPCIWEHMDTETEVSGKLDCNLLYFDMNEYEEDPIRYSKKLYKAKICLQVMNRFNEFQMLDKIKFPKQLEFDPWDDEPYDNKEFFRKLKNDTVDDLLEFTSIYYKLQLFNDRFVYPILEMFKYTNINCYEEVKEKFEEFDFDLIDLALSKVSCVQDDENILTHHVKEKIYWIKSITHMYRIPIPVELMLLVDDNPDYLYNRLDRLEDEKYYGSPNYIDK